MSGLYFLSFFITASLSFVWNTSYISVTTTSCRYLYILWMFALYKPTNSGHKGEIILTVTGHSLNQPLLISSTLPWRRWISQIGCSTFLTLNNNAARMYTSQQATPLAMMDVQCQSMLRWSARQLWFSTLLRKSKSRTYAAWSPSPMPSPRKDVLKSILCGSWVSRRSMITPASTATISMLVRQMSSWHSSRRTTSPLNKPGLLGSRHQTPITAKRPNFAKSIERRSLSRS